MIPFVNGKLTAIRQAGTSPDYDVPAVQGAARWSGVVGIYVADEMFEVDSPGRVDVLTKTRIEIPYEVGHVVENSDWLVYVNEEGVTKTRSVASVTKAQLTGRVKVFLDDE